MTTELATTQPDMGAFDENDANVIRYLGLNANSPADRAMVAVCRAYDFDPVLKHVVVIPKGGVYITRDGLLHVAHRSGQLDGIVVDQEPTLVDGEWTCRVSVYRKDMRHPFTYPGRYPLSGSNKQYAQEMALKAAESHALRRAFDVTGLPTLDEQRPERVVHVEQSAPASDRMADILGTTISAPDAAPDGPVPTSVEPPDSSGAESDPMVTAAQLKKIGTCMSKLSITERDEALGYVSMTVGRQVESRNDLTKAEAHTLIERLEADLGDAPVDAEVVA